MSSTQPAALSLAPVRVAWLREPDAPAPDAALLALLGVEAIDLAVAEVEPEALVALARAVAPSCAALVLDLAADEGAEAIGLAAERPVVLASQAALIEATARALAALGPVPLEQALVVTRGAVAQLVGAMLGRLGLPGQRLHEEEGGADEEAKVRLLLVPESEAEQAAAQAGEGVTVVALARRDPGRVLPALARVAADGLGVPRLAGCLAAARALAEQASGGELPALEAPEAHVAVAAAIVSAAGEPAEPPAEQPTSAASAAEEGAPEASAAEESAPEAGGLAEAADAVAEPGPASPPGSPSRPVPPPAEYRAALRTLRSPLRRALSGVLARAIAQPRRVVLPHGEAPGSVEAACLLAERGWAVPVLLGDLFRLESLARDRGLSLKGIRVIHPRRDKWRAPFTEALLAARGRALGLDRETAADLVEEAPAFAALSALAGEVDALVAAASRAGGAAAALGPALTLLAGASQGAAERAVGCHLVALPDRALVLADTLTDEPTSEELAEAALQAAALARALDPTTPPRVALLGPASYGARRGERADLLLERIARAVAIARRRAPDLALDGPLEAELALDPASRAATFGPRALDDMPDGPATVLVAPGLAAARIALGLLAAIAGVEVLGPVVMGLRRAVCACEESDPERLALAAALASALAGTLAAGESERAPLEAALGEALGGRAPRAIAGV